ncbi:MAG: hypothetical protein ACE5ER_00350 [Nitrospinaceae bacterium]
MGIHEPKVKAIWILGILGLAACLSIGSGFPGKKASNNGPAPVSLKEYANKAILVSNPVNLMQIPPGEMYQVNHEKFILQFFFSGPTLLGIILGRDADYPIYVRWCFFRSCEENPLDYTAVIAKVNAPPREGGYFQVKLPPRFNYHFQGLYFSVGPTGSPSPRF